MTRACKTLRYDVYALDHLRYKGVLSLYGCIHNPEELKIGLPFIILISLSVRPVILCSIYRSQFWRYFDEILYADVFWFKNKRH